MLKILVTLIALSVIAAATHANIMYAGGYDWTNAPLQLALAGLLAFGIGFATMSWRAGTRLLAACLALCLVCGEAYWMLTNSEREIAQRESIAAPATEAVAKRAAAKARFDAAATAKAATDQAAIDQAALPGCASNCARLLTDAKAKAEAELNAAREALAMLPPAKSPAALPERLGVPSWAWDLIMGGLRSMAIIGASIALALALHLKPENKTAATIAQAAAEVQAPIAKAPARISGGRPEAGDVSRFIVERVGPSPGGATELEALHADYVKWCGKKRALTQREFLTQLAKISEETGCFAFDRQGGKPVMLDVKIAA